MSDLKEMAQAPLRALDRLGEELAFYVRALIATPRSVTRYKKEILRLLA
jgi:phospholipid/cholesterol/gamma-HCH transport system permease protein